MIDADVTTGSRQDRWLHYLQDLEAYASVQLPLQTQGTLVRVTGLVLEAAGVRAYSHQRLPPNDGGIAAGQIVAWLRAHRGAAPAISPSSINFVSVVSSMISPRAVLIT